MSSLLAPVLSGGLTQFLWMVFGFLVVLTVLVFVHELGHYLIARRNGVRVEVFSIGFGPELFGWNDRSGTRWKVSALPLGGYVKMFGDSDGSSVLPTADVEEMTEAERAVSFFYKPLGQRAAIVSGGPLANFIFAIVVMAVLFATYGQPYMPPEIGRILPNSAAEKAGMQVGDVVTSIDGNPIARFDDIKRLVEVDSGNPMTIVVLRKGEPVSLNVTPKVIEDSDGRQIGQLGVQGSGGVKYTRLSPANAVLHAFSETWNLSTSTLGAMWQMITHKRNADELGGPLRIAQLSGQVAQIGVGALLSFMAMLSINLGLINLFPVPVLDGGHLLFYAAEAIRGKPLGQKAQEYGFRIGMALVLTLMVFATWNDLVHLWRS
ncbi:MAG TPA: RIP metalloprotease RseP [Stellaceae bacterium]|nr:RIP metalloprotease RseP [Stellaceae bacterium]